jgi:exopolysaccharide biosynthesis polyprenyl glycosylphosphotransferase
MSSTASVEEAQRETLPGSQSSKRIPSAVSYSPNWAWTLFAVDVSLFIVSAYLANVLAERIWHTPPFAKQITGAAIVIALWIVMFRTLGLYHRTYAFRVKDELYYTVAALCLGVMPQLIVFTIVPAISTSRVGALLSLAFSIVMVGGGRAVMHVVRNLGAFRRNARVAFVGTRPRVLETFSSVDRPLESPPLLIEVEDVNETLRGNGSGADVDLEDVPWFAQALHARCGTIAFTEVIDPHLMPRVLDVATRYHVRVAFAPPRIKRYSFTLSLETSGNQALIIASPLNACTPTARLRKRVLDLMLGAPALVLFAPIMLLCAVAVYLDSGAPILYRQDRVGMGGKIFTIYKFRSMRVDAEKNTGAVWVRENDDRRTRVGALLRRLSFDELPQIFNVLKGDMSLVGPRPERPVFVEQFRARLPRYDERHLVPPGITGWSHIHMHRLVTEDDISERLEYDLRYVEQWTIWLDVSIMFKTALEVLFHNSV